MANANRTVANMSKNPWTPVAVFQTSGEAERKAAEMRKEGKKARVTSYKMGSRKAPQRRWQVWEA